MGNNASGGQNKNNGNDGNNGVEWVESVEAPSIDIDYEKVTVGFLMNNPKTLKKNLKDDKLFDTVESLIERGQITAKERQYIIDCSRTPSDDVINLACVYMVSILYETEYFAKIEIIKEDASILAVIRRNYEYVSRSDITKKVQARALARLQKLEDRQSCFYADTDDLYKKLQSADFLESLMYIIENGFYTGKDMRVLKRNLLVLIGESYVPALHLYNFIRTEEMMNRMMTHATGLKYL